MDCFTPCLHGIHRIHQFAPIVIDAWLCSTEASIASEILSCMVGWVGPTKVLKLKSLHLRLSVTLSHPPSLDVLAD